ADVGRHLGREVGRKITIDLDGQERRARRGERHGDRAGARANLQQHILRLHIDRLHDLDGPRIRKEMLTESLARTMACRWPSATMPFHQTESVSVRCALENSVSQSPGSTVRVC